MREEPALGLVLFAIFWFQKQTQKENATAGLDFFLWADARPYVSAGELFYFSYYIEKEGAETEFHNSEAWNKENLSLLKKKIKNLAA